MERAAIAHATEVTGPLTMQAKTDGAAYLDAVADEAAARARLATVARLGRRNARTEHEAATERTRTLRRKVNQEWAPYRRILIRLTE